MLAGAVPCVSVSIIFLARRFGGMTRGTIAAAITVTEAVYLVAAAW
jgi:hypothetical protein